MDRAAKFGKRKDGRFYRKDANETKARMKRINREMIALQRKFQRLAEKKYASFGNADIRPSKIHGDGIFAARDIAEGEEIVEPAITKGFNSSLRPNAIKRGNEIFALRPIAKDEEITLNYISLRQMVALEFSK